MTERHSTRREFLKLLGAGAVLGPLRGCFSGARIQARPKPVERPNIVLIMADKNPKKLQELEALHESWANRCDVQPWPLRKPGAPVR